MRCLMQRMQSTSACSCRINSMSGNWGHDSRTSLPPQLLEEEVFHGKGSRFRNASNRDKANQSNSLERLPNRMGPPLVSRPPTDRRLLPTANSQPPTDRRSLTTNRPLTAKHDWPPASKHECPQAAKHHWEEATGQTIF